MFDASSQRGDSIRPRAQAIPAKKGRAAANASAARHCAPTEELEIAPAMTARSEWAPRTNAEPTATKAARVVA